MACSRHTRILTLPILTLSFLALGACTNPAGGEGGEDGGSNGAPFTCGSAFTPCDADPVGTWQLDSFCNYVPEDCEEARIISDNGSEAEGTMTFQADGTVNWSFDVSIQARFEGPRTCVDAVYHEFCGDDPDLCEWNFGGGPSAGGSGVWEVRDGRVVINPDAPPDEALAGAQFCADSGELQVEWVSLQQDGWRGLFSPM